MLGGMNFFERWHDYWSPQEAIDTSPKVSDEVKYTTCYMCACRCGIRVFLKDGKVRYINVNPILEVPDLAPCAIAFDKQPA